MVGVSQRLLCFILFTMFLLQVSNVEALPVAPGRPNIYSESLDDDDDENSQAVVDCLQFAVQVCNASGDSEACYISCVNLANACISGGRSSWIKSQMIKALLQCPGAV